MLQLWKTWFLNHKMIVSDDFSYFLEMKPSISNCLKIKKASEFKSEDYKPIQHMNLNVPLKNLLRIPKRIFSADGNSKLESSEQSVPYDEDRSSYVTLNFPDSSCFLNSEWKESANLVAKTFSSFFDDSAKEKTLQIKQIPYSDKFIILHSLELLIFNIIESDYSYSLTRVYNSLPKENCKFKWRCRIMFTNSKSSSLNVTINAEKLPKESDSVENTYHEQIVMPIIGATHTFDYNNISKAFKLFEIDDRRDKLREEDFLAI